MSECQKHELSSKSAIFTPDERIKEIEMLLSRSNVIDKITLNHHAFNQTEIEDFCAKHGLTWSVNGHGNWVWMEFYKNGEFMTEEAFAKLNLEKPTEISPPEQITMVVDVPFGWLTPLGDFIEADFGEHEKAAGVIVDSNGWEDEYYDWSNTKKGAPLRRDYLVEVKGYALLHNPELGYPKQTMVTHQKPLTKKQKEKLFTFYIEAGEPELAKRYFV